MQRQGSWVGNRIIIAIIGALLIGGISAAIVGYGVPLHAPTKAGAAPGSNASTATPTGQITASGIIQSIDPINNTFSIAENDNSIQQVNVTNTTQFSGNVASFNDLQPNQQATVTGTLQNDGTLNATTVAVGNG